MPFNLLSCLDEDDESESGYISDVEEMTEQENMLLSSKLSEILDTTPKDEPPTKISTLRKPLTIQV
jgi:hypothetical protein